MLLLKSLLNVWWLCIFSCYKVKDCTSFKDFLSCVLLRLSLTSEIHILLECFFARTIQKLVFPFCFSCTSNYLWHLKQINCFHVISKIKSFICLKNIPSLLEKKLIRIFQWEENNVRVCSFLMHCLLYTVYCSEVFRPPASHIVFGVLILALRLTLLKVIILLSPSQQIHDTALNTEWWLSYLFQSMLGIFIPSFNATKHLQVRNCVYLIHNWNQVKIRITCYNEKVWHKILTSELKLL